MSAPRCLLAMLLCGCPLPEDQFVLSGQVLDRQSRPRAQVEVRLLRNQVPSETRCDALEPLESTLTDEDGRYAFALIRQQITRGANARRFFRVEVDDDDKEEATVTSQTFWFPDADLDLGPLSGLSTGFGSIAETRVDERLAWRSQVGEAQYHPDRPFQRRAVNSLREWRTVSIDSLGRYDIVPVEWRQEWPWNDRADSSLGPPPGRGADCPLIDVTPCPLTDGRFVPYAFPENTRTIVLNFKQETSTKSLLFHGLVLQRPAAAMRLEFNFVLDFDNWNALGTRSYDLRLQEFSGEHCNDPGVFVSFPASAFIKPVLMRIAFEDEAKALVPILSLAEISTR